MTNRSLSLGVSPVGNCRMNAHIMKSLLPEIHYKTHFKAATAVFMNSDDGMEKEKSKRVGSLACDKTYIERKLRKQVRAHALRMQISKSEKDESYHPYQQLEIEAPCKWQG